MKRIVTCLLSALLCCVFITIAVAQENQTVIARGIGPSKEMALRDAMRRAVEQSIGIMVDSTTVMHNYQSLADSVFSRSAGYITDYQEVEHAVDAGGMHSLTISAVVSAHSITDDLTALGILKAQIGDKRFMAIFRPETHSQRELAGTGMIAAAERAINGVFAQKGFSVVDNNFAEEMSDSLDIHSGIGKLATTASNYNAELLLVFTVETAAAEENSAAYSSHIVKVNLKAVDPSTARFLSQRTGDLVVNADINGGKALAELMQTKAADKVAKAVAKAVFSDIVDRYREITTQGEAYTLWFRNFSGAEATRIFQTLRTLPGVLEARDRQQAPQLLQVDVMFVGNRMDLRTTLRSALGKHGVYLQTTQVQGNRFQFYKQGTVNPY